MKKDQNIYAVNSTDWLFAHHVGDAVNKLSNQNVAVIPIWYNPDGSDNPDNHNDLNRKIIVEDGISEQMPDGKFDDKQYPLTLLVPYNLSGNHFELAVVKLSDRETVKSINIYNNLHENYEQLKNIFAEKLQIALPETPSKVFKCDDDNPPEEVINCKDGRCGDAVIAIARLKAANKAALYKNLSDIDTVNLSKSEIFDALRERYFEEGLFPKQGDEVEQSSLSDSQSESESDSESETSQSQSTSDTEDQSNPDWSENSGDEGLGKITRIEKKHKDLFGAHTNPTLFYTPMSSQRIQTGTKGRNQGDHVISYNFMLHIIFALKGENIKTLPGTLCKIIKSIFPDKEAEIDVLQQSLEEEIKAKRSTRKDTTAIMRGSNFPDQDALKQKIAKSKSQLIELEQRHIQVNIELIASKFVEFINQMPNVTFDKSRTKNSPLKPTQKGAGRESSAVDQLVALNELLAGKFLLNTKKYSINANFLSENGGNLRHFFGVCPNRYNKGSSHERELKAAINKGFDASKVKILNNISECLFNLYDYPKTGKKDKDDNKYDDEQVLYQTLPKLMIFAFGAFKNLQKLNPKDKEEVYNKFLDKILEKQRWDQHSVTHSDKTIKLTREILKENIAKFATLDFAKDSYSMKKQQKSATIDEKSTDPYTTPISKKPVALDSQESVRSSVENIFSSSGSTTRSRVIKVKPEEVKSINQRFKDGIEAAVEEQTAEMGRIKISTPNSQESTSELAPKPSPSAAKASNIGNKSTSKKR